METKRITWLLAITGGFIGGYAPMLWGASYFSIASLLCNALGAMLGIWIAFKLTH